MNKALKIEQPKNITPQEHVAELYKMLGDFESRAAIVWDQLDLREKDIFCFAAGLEHRKMSLPLSKLNDLERRKLFRAIKSIFLASSKFRNITFKEFK